MGLSFAPGVHMTGTQLDAANDYQVRALLVQPSMVAEPEHRRAPSLYILHLRGYYCDCQPQEANGLTLSQQY